MPISKSITQPSGAVASYHVATGGGYALGGNSLTVEVNSYLDSSHTSAPLASQNVDISFVLATTAPPPPTGATVEQVVQSIVEGALIAQQTPDPASTTANPLPPINGVFYGGTIVA